MEIFCDFDGTISTTDTTDQMLMRFAEPAWALIEQDWTSGRISSAVCMREQIALIQASDEEMAIELDRVQLDHGFLDFVAWCAGHGLPLTIVSDGVDRFIHPVLARFGLSNLPVVSNRMTGAEGARSLDQPWLRGDCAIGSGVCKCAVAGNASDGPYVFIGDGRSDFCIAGRASILFAKSALADHAASTGLPYFPFDDFDDVRKQLEATIADAGLLNSGAKEGQHVRRA